MKPVLHILTLVLCAFFMMACSETYSHQHALESEGAPNQAVGTGSNPIADGSQVTANRILVLTFEQYVFGLNKNGGTNMAGDFCRVVASAVSPFGVYRIEKSVKLKLTFDKSNDYDFTLQQEGGDFPELEVTCYECDRISGGVRNLERAKLTQDRLLNILGVN